MSNFITRFFGFVIHVKAKVSDALIHIFGQQTASELAHGALAALEQTKLGQEIYKYVQEFETAPLSTLTNDVKHLQVVSKVQAFAAANNIPFLGSIVDALISLAVAKLRGYYDAIGAHDPSNVPAQQPVAPPTSINILIPSNPPTTKPPATPTS